jgi:hypothetical protein
MADKADAAERNAADNSRTAAETGDMAETAGDKADAADKAAEGRAVSDNDIYRQK